MNTTIQDVDRMVWTIFSTPPITTTRSGQLVLDGIKPNSQRTEKTGGVGATVPTEAYWFWMRRLPLVGSNIGSTEDDRYVVKTVDGEGNPETYSKYVQGSHYDIPYEMRYTVQHEQTDREIHESFAARIKREGSRYVSPGGTEYLVTIGISGWIPELDENKMGYLFRILVHDVEVGRVEDATAIPGIGETTLDIQQESIS